MPSSARARAAVVIAVAAAATIACGGMSGGGYGYHARDLPREKDGLALVTERADFDQQYLKPGVDFGGYHAILAPPLQVVYSERYEREHRLDRSRGAARMTPSARLETYRDLELERLQELFRSALARRVANDGAYRLVDEPGPGVLLLSAAVLDLDLSVGRSTYLQPGSSAWSSRPSVVVGATLRDGESGERLAELLQASRPEGSSLEPTPSFWPDVGDALEHWASDLRTMLDRHSASQRLGE